MASPVPEGYHSLTPHLIIKNAGAAIDFYKKAFGATEIMRMPGPGGKVMHAELKIGDSMLMLADEFPEYGCKGPESYGGSSVTVHLYVPDVDALFDRAVAAGATPLSPPADQWYGERVASVKDTMGITWTMARPVG